MSLTLHQRKLKGRLWFAYQERLLGMQTCNGKQCGHESCRIIRQSEIEYYRKRRQQKHSTIRQ